MTYIDVSHTLDPRAAFICDGIYVDNGGGRAALSFCGIIDFFSEVRLAPLAQGPQITAKFPVTTAKRRCPRRSIAVNASWTISCLIWSLETTHIWGYGSIELRIFSVLIF